MFLGKDWQYYIVAYHKDHQDVYHFSNLFGSAHLAWLNSSKVQKELGLIACYSGKDQYNPIIHGPRIWDGVNECWRNPVESDYDMLVVFSKMK
ncbi:hypothetical protein ZPAH1_orf00087 [Aeromonas phage ZPAH1]|nr:hypothetical protein ASwh1_39 [Aeromonas phage Aswh_1]QQG33849.1 hypothetical protein ZPAH1_orf00087 [Aeromonas phage ZPAH1]